MRNTVNITGVPVDKVTMQQALERVGTFLTEDRVHAIYTPNAEFMMNAQRNSQFRDMLCRADMCIADGAGVVLAAKILGKRLPEKVPGFDLTKNILATDWGRKINVFLLGCKPGVAELAAENILKEYKGVNIVGCRDGYFKQEEEPEIVREIAKTEPDLLLVALGQVKQESFIDENRGKLKAKVCIGVGGTIDILAGKTDLAPEFFRKNNLEWLYRLCKEPWRYKRMLDLPRYALLAVAVRVGIKKI